MVGQYHQILDNEALIINDIGRCASCHQPGRPSERKDTTPQSSGLHVREGGDAVGASQRQWPPWVKCTYYRIAAVLSASPQQADPDRTSSMRRCVPQADICSAANG